MHFRHFAQKAGSGYQKICAIFHLTKPEKRCIMENSTRADPARVGKRKEPFGSNL
jgi:hypothetical protein